MDATEDIVIRLRTRASIRRSISDRKSVQEGRADRIADQLDEAAAEIERLRADADRYQYLRSRDLDTIHMGGVFAGRVPENTVVNGADLDAAIDRAMKS